jgi:hypothetical protein
MEIHPPMKSATRRGRGPAAATLSMIAAIVEIAREMQPLGIRAIAYQLFNRKLIPSMEKKHVGRVSTLSTTARERGRLPWEWIVDPTRAEQSDPTWADPDAYAKTVQKAYRRDKWQHQPTRVSVWSEKSTVEGTIRPVLEKYAVPFQSVHGWCSATAIRDTADANHDRDQDTLILYIGDYDPSGMYMSEVDLVKRLARYSTETPEDKDVSLAWARKTLYEAGLTIRRVALTAADTVDLGPGPRFPASDKKKDSRYKWFVANHGDWCWELDAMPPNLLRRRLEEEILAVLNLEVWRRWTHTEKVEKAGIVKLCQNWNSILGQDQK